MNFFGIESFGADSEPCWNFFLIFEFLGFFGFVGSWVDIEIALDLVLAWTDGWASEAFEWVLSFDRGEGFRVI